jgi:hypothetical protein
VTASGGSELISNPKAILVSVLHSGDNQKGGDTDCEKISVNLLSIHGTTKFIVFSVSVFEPKDFTFSQLSNAYCRVLDGENELYRYNLAQGGDTNSVIYARIFEKRDLVWYLDTIEEYVAGSSARAIEPLLYRFITPVEKRPQKVILTIVSGYNLPALDIGCNSSDPYLKIKFGRHKRRTRTIKKCLNPNWDEIFEL